MRQLDDHSASGKTQSESGTETAEEFRKIEDLSSMGRFLGLFTANENL